MTNRKLRSGRHLLRSYGLSALAIVALTAGCSPKSVNEMPPLSPAEETAKRASALQFEEDYDGAIVTYTAAIALDANYVDAHLNRGLCHFALGKFDEALVDFDNAIRLRPDLAAAYEHRGATHQQLGDPDKAASDKAESDRLSKAKN